MKLILALCGAALIAGCSSAPVQPVQKVESNTACDYALMDRINRTWVPTLTARYWVNCPQVRPSSSKQSGLPPRAAPRRDAVVAENRPMGAG